MPMRSQFLTTSRMLRLFSAGVKAPPKGARVVYIDGAWDMFHSGHVAVLKEVSESLLLTLCYSAMVVGKQ
jgi:ethanolamine-phosphate cytidylyltransferase